MNHIRVSRISSIFQQIFRKILLAHLDLFTNEEYFMKFSTRLENLLEERNLTQKFLSSELNIAPSTLNGYLRRNREPDFETLIKLAEFFSEIGRAHV